MIIAHIIYEDTGNVEMCIIIAIVAVIIIYTHLLIWLNFVILIQMHLYIAVLGGRSRWFTCHTFESAQCLGECIVELLLKCMVLTLWSNNPSSIGPGLLHVYIGLLTFLVELGQQKYSVESLQIMWGFQLNLHPDT